MEIIQTLIDFILHIETHLDFMILNYHTWTYLFLFLIIFVETGLIIMPFLPGDSLLFVIGAFAARGSFDFVTISLTLLIAAILGDSVNYSIGKYFGAKAFSDEGNKLFNKQHLHKAHAFYEKYGGKTIILARFIPIVRTFAPFVAGAAKMTYKNFMIYNIVGAISWIMSFITLGYFFGNMAYVKSNFKIVILAIIVISILPGVFEYLREKRKQKLI